MSSSESIVAVHGQKMAFQHDGDTTYIIVSFSHPGEQPISRRPEKRYSSAADMPQNMVHDIPPAKLNPTES